MDETEQERNERLIREVLAATAKPRWPAYPGSD